MFCLLCQSPNAGAGAYLPGSPIRVCLNCYIKTVGQIPLPAGAAGLGGKFADARLLASSIKSEGVKKAGSLFSDLSKSVATAGLGRITDGTSNITSELFEAKEVAQQKLLGNLDGIKSKFNDHAGALQSSLGDRATGIKEKLNSKGGKLFKKLEGLGGKLF